MTKKNIKSNLISKQGCFNSLKNHIQQTTLKKYKIKHILKNNIILKTQDMNQWQDKILFEIVIFQLYFKVILKLSDDDFEIKLKYYSFNQNFILSLTHILSFQDKVIFWNMFYLNSLRGRAHHLDE